MKTKTRTGAYINVYESVDLLYDVYILIGEAYGEELEPDEVSEIEDIVNDILNDKELTTKEAKKIEIEQRLNDRDDLECLTWGFDVILFAR